MLWSASLAGKPVRPGNRGCSLLLPLDKRALVKKPGILQSKLST